VNDLENLAFWLEKNPGPWDVAMWTSTDNKSPLEYSAGYMVCVMDNWEMQENIFKMQSQYGGELVLIKQAIEQVEEIDVGSITCVRFAYVNLAVPVEQFKPHVIFTISKSDKSKEV